MLFRRAVATIRCGRLFATHAEVIVPKPAPPGYSPAAALGLRGNALEEGVVAVAAAAVGEEGVVADTAPLGIDSAPETRA